VMLQVPQKHTLRILLQFWHFPVSIPNPLHKNPEVVGAETDRGGLVMLCRYKGNSSLLVLPRQTSRYFVRSTAPRSLYEEHYSLSIQSPEVLILRIDEFLVHFTAYDLRCLFFFLFVFLHPYFVLHF
jgi:hypothetical protein